MSLKTWQFQEFADELEGNRKRLALTWEALKAPVPVDLPLLGKGAKGAAVRDVQDRLRALGYDPGATDGDFGKRTETAVRALQASKGRHTSSGIVDRATWIQLGRTDTVPMMTRLTQDQKVAWNALIYVQQGMELQLAAAAAKAGGGRYELNAARGLGVFSGLPGGGGGGEHKDGRFAVPKLEIYRGLDRIAAGDAVVGLAPLVIGAWLVVGVVAVIVLGLTIKAAVGMLSGHSTNIKNYAAQLKAQQELYAKEVEAKKALYAQQLAEYEKYAAAEREKGRVPSPPPPPPDIKPPAPPGPPPPDTGMGISMTLGLVALGAAGLFLATRKAA